MKEKYVKIQSHQSRISSMREKLQAALKEVHKAHELATKTAYCCEASLESLASEIMTQIAVADMHLAQGLLEDDVIRKEAT